MKFLSRLLIPAVLGCCVLFADPARGEIKADFEMFHDPLFDRPITSSYYSARLAKLWIEALERSEVDMQRLSAESMAKGVKLGVKGLEPAIPRLRELLLGESTHTAVRVAAARALVAFDDRESASALATVAGKFSGDVRQLCETALGDWKFEPIRGEWRDRLTRTGVRHRELVVAIRGLGLAGDPQSAPRLLELTHSPLQPAEIRIESALAAGRLQTTGLATDAQKLIDAKTGTLLINRICAARVLAKHQAADAQAQLLKLAIDQEPAVAGEALRLLNEIDSRLVLPLAGEAMKSPDGLVRRQGMLAYVKLPTVERIPAIVAMLDDLLPSVRGEAREAVHELLMQESLRPTIWVEVLAMLAQPSWRGEEQAALLVGANQHQPAAKRLLEMQSIGRGEARVAAAWALRKVAVPETCPAIFLRAQQLTKQRNGGPRLESIDEQCAHLMEALAVMKFWEAEALWREYVPKNLQMGSCSRGASIWALGLRFEEQHQPELAQQLVERLTDNAPLPPEMPYVRYSSAIALGRMKAKEQVRQMLDWVGEENLKSGHVSSEPALAIRWAMTQITGEVYPDLKPILRGKQGWFLESTIAEDLK